MPFAIAIDSTHDFVYWTDSLYGFIPGRIRRTSMKTNETVDLVTGLVSPTGLAVDVDRGKMYWTDSVMKTVARANLDGTEVEWLLSDFPSTVRLALDSARGHMYLNGSGGIWRADFDGASPVYLGYTDLVTFGSYLPSIALDLTGEKMYFNANSSWDIHRANLDGTGREPVLKKSPWRFFGLAVDPDSGRFVWIQPGNYEDSYLVSTCHEGSAFKLIAGGGAEGRITDVAFVRNHIELTDGHCAEDLRSYALFQECFRPMPDLPQSGWAVRCASFDFDGDDGVIGYSDFSAFLESMNGP